MGSSPYQRRKEKKSEKDKLKRKDYDPRGGKHLKGISGGRGKAERCPEGEK